MPCDKIEINGAHFKAGYPFTIFAIYFYFIIIISFHDAQSFQNVHKNVKLDSIISRRARVHINSTLHIIYERDFFTTVSNTTIPPDILWHKQMLQIIRCKINKFNFEMLAVWRALMLHQNDIVVDIKWVDFVVLSFFISDGTFNEEVRNVREAEKG